MHLPGYPLVLAALAKWRGYTFEAAAALNVACFAITVLSAFVIARSFFRVGRSLLAAALVSVLPPYPGYLAVAYPEHLTAAALLVLVAMALCVRGRLGAFLLGFLLGVSLLFR
ncbi:MAG: hypothetical protein JJE39_09385, partial [Vicinamibacteria bacterium]|nr:hypothetical protein [Vicinamibacteria bacterium]